MATDIMSMAAMTIATTATMMMVIAINIYDFNNLWTRSGISASKQTAERCTSRCHKCNKDYAGENLYMNSTNDQTNI